MTIQEIAKKQLDQLPTIHFARKGTANCYWFDFGSLRSYSDTDMAGTRASLSVEDLAASDWRVIKSK